jgi:predicted DsbA family dithiol-disulfide isomerase
MKVEIWSDIMCPFCYIGKRKFEQALQSFENKEEIEIEWKSFQLDPEIVSNKNRSVNEYLAERKGWSVEQARKLNADVTSMAKEVGLDYDFDKAIIANSFDAHRLIQFAKTKGLGDVAEEALFRAYFTEGKNIADTGTLIALGVGIGLDQAEVKQMLESDSFGDEVQMDIYEAQQVGVRGVPFFVVDNKYAVSGAQSPEVFRQVLERAVIEQGMTGQEN